VFCECIFPFILYSLGETFVTRKVTRGVAKIHLGLMETVCFTDKCDIHCFVDGVIYLKPCTLILIHLGPAVGQCYILVIDDRIHWAHLTDVH